MQENIISRKDIQHVGGSIAAPQGKGPRPFFSPDAVFRVPQSHCAWDVAATPRRRPATDGSMLGTGWRGNGPPWCPSKSYPWRLRWPLPE